MSEKIKAMYGDDKRADEVRQWLEDQGGQHDGMFFDRSDLLYFVNPDTNYIDVKVEEDAFIFDIVELPEKHKFKPFDKVLVRDNEHNEWLCNFYSHYQKASDYHYVCLCGGYKRCIPYEGNEHLVGTTDSPKGGEE